MESKNVKKISYWGAVALVFSGMVGSGILFIAKDMAPYRTWGLFCWIVGAVMTYCMFLSFARVNDYYLAHSKNENPDILDFLRLRYCDNTSFLIGFGHFCAATVSCALTSLSLAEYFLNVTHLPMYAQSVATLGLLIMFAMNLFSFGLANVMNFWLTFLKLISFLVIAVWGSFYVNNYVPEYGSIINLFKGASTSMFAFAGIEFAVFASGSIENAKENVVKATRMGLILSAIVFIGVYAACAFTVDADTLSKTATPLALCAEKLIGAMGVQVVSAIAVLSCLTTLNGILVVQGNSFKNFAKKKCVPALFLTESAQGFPYRGAFVSLLITFILIWMPYKVDAVYTVDFIGVLYSAVVLLDIMLTGLSLSAVLGLISCGIMLFKTNLIILSVLVSVYFFGFLVKSLNSYIMKVGE